MGRKDESEQDPEEGEPAAKQEEAVDGGGGGEEKSKRRRKRKRKKKESKQEHDDEANQDLQEDASAAAKNDDADGDEKMKKTLEVDRTVFVEGIPYSCTPRDVRDFFSSHGIEDIADVRLPVWQDSGRLRGYGHVVFESVASRDKAIKELNGKHLQNRFLNITAAKAPKGSSSSSSFGASSTVDPTDNPSKTIMLNNLSYEAEEDDVSKVLEKYGTIVDGGVRVVRHSATGRSKGFAYVEFEQMDSAIQVIKDNRVIVHNRRCRVEYDHGRVKGSFRTADHKLWHKEYGRLSGGKRSKHGEDD